MKTGLESLDAGASDITYSGNEGPKSPQEDQRMMQEFQMQQMAGGENDRVRELLLLEETQGLTEEEKEELRQLIKTISAQLPQGGLGDMPMDMGEPTMEMPEEMREMAAFGGIMGEDGRRGYIGGSYAGKDPEGGNQGSGQYQGGSGAPGSAESKGMGGDGGRNDGPEPDYGKAKKEFELAVGKGQLKGPTTSLYTTGVKDINLPIPYVGTILNNKFVKKLRNKGLKKNINYFLEQETDYPQTLEGYKDYMRDRLAGNITASGNQIQQGGGESLDINNNQNQLLLNTNLTDTDTDLASVIPYRGDQFLRRDNQLALAADGGRIGYADGGITDLRQGYFLGKLVKKATRGIKKIVKSPLGKAALLGFGMFGIPGGSGLTGGLLNSSFMTSGMGLKLKNKLLMQNLGEGEYGGFDPFKIGILGASALTGLMAKNSEDDEPSLNEYMKTASRGPSIDPRGIRQMIAANKGNINPQDFAFLNPAYYQNAADGGRIGLAAGGIGNLRGALSKQMFGYDDDEEEIKKLAFGGSAGMPPVTMMPEGQNIKAFNDDESMNMAQGPQNPMPMPIQRPMMDPRMMQQMMMMAQQQGGMKPMMGNRMMAAMGGRMGFADGGDEGELLDMGGLEKDYRNEGGFVPMGEYERKDDVPARLSKNEFVFTADAVRNAGGGDIDKGAEIMENMMENLEQGGKVSKGSQGLSGAREMFATQQRLGEVL